MTPPEVLDLDALDAIAKAATPGPWVPRWGRDPEDGDSAGIGPSHCSEDPEDDEAAAERDAAFIAAARTALPLLTAEVRKVRDQLEFMTGITVDQHALMTLVRDLVATLHRCKCKAIATWECSFWDAELWWECDACSAEARKTGAYGTEPLEPAYLALWDRAAALGVTP